MSDDTHRTIDRGVARLTQALKAFDPNQTRDDHGRWTAGDAAGTDTSNHTDEDTAFIAKFGKEFTPVINHAWGEYGISSDTLQDLKKLYPNMGPAELGKFIEANYEGDFSTDAEIADHWLSQQADLNIPDVVLANADMDGVGIDLTKPSGPLMQFYDGPADANHVFKRPTKG